MSHSQTNQMYSPVKVGISTAELMQYWSADKSCQGNIKDEFSLLLVQCAWIP